MKRKHRDAGGGSETRECRCLCGSLVARVVRDGVELKCRRCKRTMIVPLAPPAEVSGVVNPVGEAG